MYDIGIDLGTSAVKILLVNDQGRVVKKVTRSYPLEYPQKGWSQQNPQDWWNRVSDGVTELISDIRKEEIGGIGVAGQMHGLVALDAEGTPIRPAILWNDGRASDETDYLNTALGPDFLLEHTGNIAVPGFTAPKLLWMRENEPDLFRKIRMVLLPKDYINYRLTGEYATDFSDAAGTLLLDVKEKRWSPEMLEICGLSEDQLPGLHESADLIGCVRPETAARLGLSEKTVVAAGAGDNAAAAIGTGCLREGQCNLSLGTSGTIFIPCETYRQGTENVIHMFCHAAGNYHFLGCILSAASCLKWWTEEICKTTDYNGLQAEIDPNRLGKNRVFFLPYLMGERAPHNDPFARGTFIGMTMDSTRADMTQAVLEGVAFAFRDLIEGVRESGITVSRATLCGGGAQSDLWKTILANTLHLKLDLPEEEQGPGLGGAILAACGRGGYAGFEEAANNVVRIGGTIDPDEELSALYEQKYRVFRRLYPSLKGMFRDICGS